MIPASHITPFVDGLAWWVVPSDEMAVIFGIDPPQSMMDRSCDACKGDRDIGVGSGLFALCVCIDGRHTFEIEVEPVETVEEAARAAAKDLYRAEVHRQGVGWDEFCTILLLRSQHRLATALSKTAVTHRVSVVPGMVLPILYDGDGHSGDQPHVCACETDRDAAPYAFFPMPNGDETVAGVPFPPAAEPGMWAVHLRKTER